MRKVVNVQNNVLWENSFFYSLFLYKICLIILRGYISATSDMDCIKGICDIQERITGT